MLSKFSVKKPLTVVVGIIIVIILGIVSYVNTGVDLLPSMNLPYIVVVTINPGASPEEIEKTITRPVEDGLSTVANITEITSESSEHFSMVMLEFNYEADLDRAYADVKAALDLVAFPNSDLLQDPIVLKINPTMLPIMRISLSKEGTTIKDSNVYLAEVIEKINGLDGVANISANGLITNLAYININSDKLAGSVLDYAQDLLGIELKLPTAVKEELRAGLSQSVDIENVTPQMVVNTFKEILRNTQQWNEDNFGDNIMKYIIDLLLAGLEDTNSIIYKTAIFRAEELIDNKFILMDNDDSKAVFYDFIDQIIREAIVQYANNQIGSIINLISPEILSQVLYAQDFDMPSGSIQEGAISYIVKIGTTINTRGELIDLPVISFDVGAQLSTRVDQLQRLLTLISIATDGKLTFSEGDLIRLSDAIYDLYGREEEPNDTGVGYGTASIVSLWARTTMPSQITENLPQNWDSNFTSYLMEKAPAKWNRGFNANWRIEAIDLFIDCFDLYLTQLNVETLNNMQDNYLVTNISDEQAYAFVGVARAALPDSILFNLPFGWENTLKDIYVENIDVDWSMPAYVPRNDLVKQLLDIFAENMPAEWIPDLPANWQTSMKTAADNSVIPTFTDLIRRAISNLSPEFQLELENLFRERSREDIQNFFRSSITLLKLFSPDAVIIPQKGEGGSIPLDAEYSIDFVLIKETIDNLENKAVIPLKLGSIADITFLDDATEQITTLLSRVNGILTPSAAVNISIEKEPDKSTAEITKRIENFLKETKAKDSTFNYTILTNDGESIAFMLNNVVKNLLYGGLLAVGILFLFLKDIKATMVVGFSIVISVVATFVMMYFAGLTLNIVSMGGLALGVGMLVDNSIVIIENIYRMRAQGKNIFVASIQGAKQVTSAIVASTLTTVIVFLPIAFIEGLTKQIFTDMALTITFSLLASLLVALTLVPMSTSTLIKKPAKKESKVLLTVKKGYAKSLNFALNHKIVPLIVVIVLFGSSIFMIFNMDNELFPDADSGSLNITSSIDKVAIDRYNAEKPLDEPYLTYDDVVQIIIDDIIKETKMIDEIESVGISLSGGITLAGFTLGETDVSANIKMVDEKKRSFGSIELAARLKKSLDDFSKTKGLYTINTSGNTMMGSFDMMGGDQTIKLFGKDLDLMRTEAQKIKDLLTKKDNNGNILFDERGNPIFLDGISKVTIGNESAVEEYRIRINKTKANMYGLTVAQVFLQLQSALTKAGVSHTLNLINDDNTNSEFDVYIYNNDYKVNSWYVCKDDQGKEIPVYVLNNRNDENDTALNNYFIKNTYGRSVYVKHQNKNVFVNKDGNIPLSKNGNDFVYTVINEGDNALKFIEKKLSRVDSSIHYKVDRIQEFDIITYGIHSANLLNPAAPTIVVPLYKMLDDECFLKDNNGNIIYRNASDFSFERIPAGLVTSKGYDTIVHENKKRVERISITFAKDVNANNMSKQINNLLDKEYQVPSGLTLDLSEGNKYIDEVFTTLYFVLALAIVLIYLVMVAQFQSVKSPLIIMITLPMAFTGCIFALFMANMSLSVMAMIGLIVLMGIVVNNGIVFVDYCNQMIQNNVPKRMALLRTGIDRLRPILMTAFTTIFALIIMAADTTEGGAILRPLAIAAIGGLVYSTVLTLYIVPVIYDLLNRKAKQSKRTKAFLDKDIDLVTSSEVEDILTSSSSSILNDIVPSNELGEAVASINKDIESSLLKKERQSKEEQKQEQTPPSILRGRRLRYSLPVRKDKKKKE